METTETHKPQATIYARLACRDKWVDTRLDAQIEAGKKSAADHGLIIKNVITEVESGSSLKQRFGLRSLLEQARSGQVTHVIISDFTRLLRTGKAADWRHIAEAFVAGGVTVIAGDAEFDFGKPETVACFLNGGLAAGSQTTPKQGRENQVLY